jgi:hypothetical protein|tara:strand:+ start:365 stop:514 length:150 start_codon:yes stop_codon:yes gene_type:complete
MDYVLLYTFMFFYEAVEQHIHQSAAPATEISLVVSEDQKPEQVTLLINE